MSIGVSVRIVQRNLSYVNIEVDGRHTFESLRIGRIIDTYAIDLDPRPHDRQHPWGAHHDTYSAPQVHGSRVRPQLLSHDRPSLEIFFIGDVWTYNCTELA